MENGQIYAAISTVMGKIDYIGKDRQADGGKFSYKFRGIDDVYNALHTPMVEAGIFTASKVVGSIHEAGKYDSGSAYRYSRLTMEYTFYAKDGSHISTQTVGVGMDQGDKADNKAMAVAHKYALMQIFAIPTEDDKDPELDSHIQPAKDAPVPAKPSVPKAPVTPTAPVSVFAKLSKQIESAKLMGEVNAFKYELKRQIAAKAVSDDQATVLNEAYNSKLSALKPK